MGNESTLFSIDDIDEIIHGRVRLGIITLLIANGGMDFKSLRKQLGLTDGNLATHMRKLEDAGYIRVEKRFDGRKPLTTAEMTEVGRRAYLSYLETMQKLIPSNG